MLDQHALGLARRAGGVDRIGEPMRLGPLDQRLARLLGQFPNAAGRCQRPGEFESGIIAQHALRAAVADQMARVLQRQRGIDADECGAGAKHRQLREVQLGVFTRNADRHELVGLHQRHQRLCQRSRTGLQFAVRPFQTRPPLTGGNHQRGCVRVEARALEEELVEQQGRSLPDRAGSGAWAHLHPIWTPSDLHEAPCGRADAERDTAGAARARPEKGTRSRAPNDRRSDRSGR